MPPILLVILMAIMFTAVLAISQSLYFAYIIKRENDKAELARRLGTTTEEEFQSLFRASARDAAANALGALGTHLQETINQADSPMQVGQLLMQMAGLGVVGALFGGFMMGSMGIILGTIAGAIPYVLLRRAGNIRARNLLEQLPDALDLMARSLQAGLGLNDAFKMCAEEMRMPVAAEFGRVFEEVRFGRDYREALNNLTKRNPAIFDLRLFVSSVLLQRETGGNLIEILENIATTIRARFLFDAKVKAMTSEARFSALILGALPLCVAFMIYYMNPEYLLPLVTDPLGRLMLLGCFCLYFAGTYLMYAISQVEV